MSPIPPFLQTKKPRFSQLLFISFVLQTFSIFVVLLWTHSSTQFLCCSKEPKIEHRIQRPASPVLSLSPSGHAISDTSTLSKKKNLSKWYCHIPWDVHAEGTDVMVDKPARHRVAVCDEET